MLKMGVIGRMNDGILLEHWISICNSIQDCGIGLDLCSTSSEMARPADFRELITHVSSRIIFTHTRQAHGSFIQTLLTSTPPPRVTASENRFTSYKNHQSLSKRSKSENTGNRILPRSKRTFWMFNTVMCRIIFCVCVSQGLVNVWIIQLKRSIYKARCKW